MNKSTSSYAQAGVDIDQMMDSLSQAKRMVSRTSVKGVLSHIGSFGGLFAAPGKEFALVASTDGVGTKLKIAVMADRHHTVGQDLVNHCVNDILVQGAKPLFFLDYLGAARLEPRVFRDLMSGLCKACRENHCALLGGETAEMPGLYPEGEYDLVGTIIGAVNRRRIVNGQSIRPGDVLIGLPSTGLHTNGYSLARKIVFEKAGLSHEDLYPGTRKNVADVLLSVHRSYLQPVTSLMQSVKVQGMAHITGGGLVDNVPRSLPPGTTAVIDREGWRVPTVFDFLRDKGNIDESEMFRVFNMGIGFVVIVRPSDTDQAMALLKRRRAAPRLIGYVTEGKGQPACRIK